LAAEARILAIGQKEKRTLRPLYLCLSERGGDSLAEALLIPKGFFNRGGDNSLWYFQSMNALNGWKLS
jgi:hypothetical protein